jgi:hypothetical protein
VLHSHFRLLFSVIELPFAVLLARPWHLHVFADWPLEEKLAFALLAVAPIAKNPLCPPHALSP